MLGCRVPPRVERLRHCAHLRYASRIRGQSGSLTIIFHSVYAQEVPTTGLRFAAVGQLLLVVLLGGVICDLVELSGLSRTFFASSGSLFSFSLPARNWLNVLKAQKKTSFDLLAASFSACARLFGGARRGLTPCHALIWSAKRPRNSCT